MWRSKDVRRCVQRYTSCRGLDAAAGIPCKDQQRLHSHHQPPCLALLPPVSPPTGSCSQATASGQRISCSLSQIHHELEPLAITVSTYDWLMSRYGWLAYDSLRLASTSFYGGGVSYDGLGQLSAWSNLGVHRIQNYAIWPDPDPCRILITWIRPDPDPNLTHITWIWIWCNCLVTVFALLT